MKTVEMTAKEYLLSFIAAILNRLCDEPRSKECMGSMERIQRDVDQMPFMERFGDLRFSFLQEPEEHAVRILGESKQKVNVPIEIAEAVARTTATLLVDSWGKAILNL